MRYAASGLHRKAITHRRTGDRHQFPCVEHAVPQHEDRLAWCGEYIGQGSHDVAGIVCGSDVDHPTPYLGMFGCDDARKSPQATLPHRCRLRGFADARGEDPQRDRIAIGPLGEKPYQISDFGRNPDGIVHIRVRVVGRLAIGDVEDVAGVGEFGGRMAGLP